MYNLTSSKEEKRAYELEKGVWHISWCAQWFGCITSCEMFQWITIYSISPHRYNAVSRLAAYGWAPTTANRFSWL